MKKFTFYTTAVLALALVFTGCQAKSVATEEGTSKASVATENVTIKVGADLVPHSEILKFIQPKLAEQGVTLEIVNFDDSGQLNPSLQEGQLDANYFQHVPYLESVAAEKGYEFEVLANVHVEPIGLYSEKIKTIEELKDGALIAIPDNPSNEYRALVLLEANGLIKLKAGIENFSATPADILENPRNFKFIEIDAGQLTRSLPDVDVAVINTNRILEAGIDPKTALVRENADSPYGNIVVVRKGDETRPELIKLKDALLSPEVKQFIIDTYGVAVVPAF